MSNENQPNSPGQASTPAKPNSTEVNTKVRLSELVNVNRIVSNAINLINDVEIKGAHAGPVTEILGWLTGFSQSLTGQIKTLKSTLPKETEPKKPELKSVKPAVMPYGTPDAMPDVAPTKVAPITDGKAYMPDGSPVKGTPAK